MGRSVCSWAAGDDWHEDNAGELEKDKLEALFTPPPPPPTHTHHLYRHSSSHLLAVTQQQAQHTQHTPLKQTGGVSEFGQ